MDAAGASVIVSDGPVPEGGRWSSPGEAAGNDLPVPGRVTASLSDHRSPPTNVVLFPSFPWNGSKDCAARGGRLPQGLLRQDLHHIAELNLAAAI